MNIKPCIDCGRQTLDSHMLRKHPEWRGIYFHRASKSRCQACHKRAKNAARGPRVGAPRPIAELIEDIEWLKGTDCPENIAQRVGYPNLDTLARRLVRHGRHDLARMFDLAAPERVAS